MNNPLAIAGTIGVIVSVLKNWDVEKKYYFIASILLGCLYYFYWMFQGQCSLILALQNGIISGGTASGLYSGVKFVSNNNSVIKQIINPLTFRKGK